MAYLNIKQDPVNALLDMLPQFTLEMRRQDIQRKQFQQVDKRRQEAHDANMDLIEQNKLRRKTLSDFFERNLNHQIDMRNRIKENEAFIRNNASDFDAFNKIRDGKTVGGAVRGWLGLMTDYDFEDYLREKATVPQKMRNYGVEETPETIKYAKKLKDFKKLPDLLMTDYPEINVPAGLDIDPTLFELIRNTLNPVHAQQIDNIFRAFGGRSLGADSIPFATQSGRRR